MDQNTRIFYQETAFENVICQVSTILFRTQYVQAYTKYNAIPNTCTNMNHTEMNYFGKGNTKKITSKAYKFNADGHIQNILE